MRRPSTVDIREVGPRDGLQPEQPTEVTDRVRLIEALLDAGVTHLEAVSFVSPKAVPAMAGAADVLAAIKGRPGLIIAALVPNERGAELALATGAVDELTVTISISETYNQRNVNRSTGASLKVVEAVAGLAEPAGVPVDAVVSCAFGSPYEGDVSAAAVAALGTDLAAAGASRVTYADTTGMGTPRLVTELLEQTGPDIGLHLHETRGTALLNAFVALEAGVARFDTSVGGLGGSPFATGAAGNLATEELVAVLDDLGVHTGLSVDGLCAAASLVSTIIGRPVPSRVATVGPRTRLAGLG